MKLQLTSKLFQFCQNISKSWQHCHNGRVNWFLSSKMWRTKHHDHNIRKVSDCSPLISSNVVGSKIVVELFTFSWFMIQLSNQSRHIMMLAFAHKVRFLKCWIDDGWAIAGSFSATDAKGPSGRRIELGSYFVRIWLGKTSYIFAGDKPWTWGNFFIRNLIVRM